MCQIKNNTMKALGSAAYEVYVGKSSYFWEVIWNVSYFCSLNKNEVENLLMSVPSLKF